MPREISDPIEKIIADGLTAAGIRFVHESEAKEVTLSLDFYIPDLCIFIECKQFWSEGLSDQMKRASNVIAIQGRAAAHAFVAMIRNQQIKQTMTSRITWAERVANLTKALGRKPTLDELLEASQIHEPTPEEVEAQRQSFVRAFTTPCEHGELDFEQCPKCRQRWGQR